MLKSIEDRLREVEYAFKLATVQSILKEHVRATGISVSVRQFVWKQLDRTRNPNLDGVIRIHNQFDVHWSPIQTPKRICSEDWQGFRSSGPILAYLEADPVADTTRMRSDSGRSPDQQCPPGHSGTPVLPVRGSPLLSTPDPRLASAIKHSSRRDRLSQHRVNTSCYRTV